MSHKKNKHRKTDADDVTRNVGKALAKMGIDYTFDEHTREFDAELTEDGVIEIHLHVTVRPTTLSILCKYSPDESVRGSEHLLPTINAQNANLIYGALYYLDESEEIAFEYGYPFTETRMSKLYVRSLLRMVMTSTLRQIQMLLDTIDEASSQDETPA